MATITEWLETKDYATGVGLLAQYSKNRALLQSLGRRHMPEKLEYELRKIATAQGLKPAPVAKKIQPVQRIKDQVIDKMNAEPKGERLKVIRNDREVLFDDLPRELQARWTQNRDNYKEIRSLHEKLKLMEKASPEDRQPLTMRISDMDDQIRENWKMIDAWDGTTDTPAPVLDHKRINANRKFICTNIAKLNRIDDEVKRATIIQNLEDRYNELKNAGELFAFDTINDLTILGIKC
jgi:predicted nuclease with TOPRIM domain